MATSSSGIADWKSYGIATLHKHASLSVSPRRAQLAGPLVLAAVDGVGEVDPLAECERRGQVAVARFGEVLHE